MTDKFTRFNGVLFRPVDGQGVRYVDEIPVAMQADAMRGTYAGASCFLIGGGPSINKLDLSLLRQRGILTAAMNNVAATHVRPLIWFAADDQTRFSETIWRDPGIAKFVKAKYLCKDGDGKKQIRKWSTESQTFIGTGHHPWEMPNVWGYDHWKGWDAETFLDDPRPSWGVPDGREDGIGMGMSVMLVSVWMLYWLGVRRIYLVGCDFRMSEKHPYAFEQEYDSTRIEKNNSLYRWLRKRFAEARPHFERRGLTIIQTNPASSLDVFDVVPYSDAVAEVLGSFPAGGRVAGHYHG